MSETPKKRIIFEGWRFIPHSAAIVAILLPLGRPAAEC